MNRSTSLTRVIETLLKENPIKNTCKEYSGTAVVETASKTYFIKLQNWCKNKLFSSSTA